jgi:hypothetical protein
METINYIIILLLIIIIGLKYYDSIIENYTTLWTPSSCANQNLVNTQCTAMNMNPSNRKLLQNYGNFGIIGKFPAIPICNSCNLEFDCVNYAYDDVDDRNVNVCRKCKKNVLYKNYNQLDEPLFVFARSAGRPRQCRKIN